MSVKMGKKKKKKILKNLGENPNGTTDYKQVEVEVDENDNIVGGNIEELMKPVNESTEETVDVQEPDWSFLKDIKKDLLLADSKKQKEGRQLTEVERLTVLITRRQNDVATQLKAQAEMLAEQAKLHNQIAQLAQENVQFKLEILNKNSEDQLNKIGMVLGHPIRSKRDGSMFFPEGQAPEELEKWIETVQRKKDEPQEETGSDQADT